MFFSKNRASIAGAPRILLCCNSSFGIARFRMSLIKALLKNGCEVIVASPPDQYSREIVDAGVKFFPWHVAPGGKNLVTELRAVYSLRRILESQQPDLCINYTIKSVLYGSMAAVGTNIPLLSVITGLGYAFLNDSATAIMARILYKFLLKRSRRVMFLNQQDLHEFTRRRLVDPVLSGILPGEGVDTDFYRPDEIGIDDPKSTQRNFIFLMVSRLLADKGVLEFVEACRMLKRDGYAIEGLLLGDTDSKNPSAVPKAQLDIWIKDGCIRHLGKTTDVRGRLKEADCIVLPSYREGIPRALLEASSMALPVIATEVPGCSDVVINGLTGLLCRPRDAVDLARTMEIMLKFPQVQRVDMGCSGRSYVVEKFSDGIVLERYFDVLAEILPSWNWVQSQS